MWHSDLILVVEDDPSIRQLLVEVLRDEGYRVRAVDDGRQALEYLASATPSLLILDIALPHVDGFAICRWVRREPRLTHLPVLMVSAFTQPSIAETARRSGASVFLPKPFDIDVVIAQIAALLASGPSTPLTPTSSGKPSHRAPTDRQSRARRERPVHGRSQRPPQASEQPATLDLLGRVASSLSDRDERSVSPQTS